MNSLTLQPIQANNRAMTTAAKPAISDLTLISSKFMFVGEVEGELASKSNSRRIVRFGNRAASIKSQKALDYAQRFSLAVRGTVSKPYDGDVALYAEIYYKSRRPDLDVALLQDCIQNSGIIKNDRQVVEIHAWKYLDRDRPRVEFKVVAV